jgi:hypothetical protein
MSVQPKGWSCSKKIGRGVQKGYYMDVGTKRKPSRGAMPEAKPSQASQEGHRPELSHLCLLPDELIEELKRKHLERMAASGVDGESEGTATEPA